MAYRFAFRSSFAGCFDFDVWRGRDYIGRAKLTMAPLSDYWRQWSTNQAADDSALDILRLSGGTSAPADMVEAFNAWRAAEYEAAKVEMARRFPDDWERHFPAPHAPATSGRYDAVTGLWSAIEAPATGAAGRKCPRLLSAIRAAGYSLSEAESAIYARRHADNWGAEAINAGGGACAVIRAALRRRALARRAYASPAVVAA